MIEFLIKTKVEQAIRQLFLSKPEDFEHTRESMKRLTDFCLNHPNRPQLQRNLCKEIRECELRLGVQFTSEDLDRVCRDFAQTFARAALQLQEESYLTNAEKNRLIEQAKAPERAVEKAISDGIIPQATSVKTFLETGEIKTETDLTA